MRQTLILNRNSQQGEHSCVSQPHPVWSAVERPAILFAKHCPYFKTTWLLYINILIVIYTRFSSHQHYERILRSEFLITNIILCHLCRQQVYDFYLHGIIISKLNETLFSLGNLGLKQFTRSPSINHMNYHLPYCSTVRILIELPSDNFCQNKLKVPKAKPKVNSLISQVAPPKKAGKKKGFYLPNERYGNSRDFINIV